MAWFGGLFTANILALRGAKPNQIINILIKPSSVFFSTAFYNNARISKLLNMKNDGLAGSYNLHNVYTSTLDTRFKEYHAQPDDVYFEDDVETKKNIRFGETGKKVISETLQKELNCTKDVAEKMVQDCKHLPRLKFFAVKERIEYFYHSGISEASMIANPWLLTLDVQKTSSRLKYIKEIGLEINEGVYLLKLSSKMLCHLSQTAKDDSYCPSGENRLRLLSKLLERNMSEVCKIVAKHPFLCSIPYPRIEVIMNILLANNITLENILKDMWVFRYSPAMIEYRLQRASSLGYPNIKPWLVHCSEAAYERSLERKTRVIDTLGPNGSVHQYLAHRLDCSCENVSALYNNYPLLSTVHINKMKETLDYLFAEKFTALQIKLVPRILCHSLDTIKERLVELRELGHTPTSLYTLCLSKRQYAEHILKLKTRQSLDAVRTY